ncbi:MAG: LptF/LptG family permease [Bacteroides sp.]|nr:LptF/LptG family permease [Bacteroides sp.]
MLRIKKLDIFVLKSFLLLFVATFFICLFIFMMQFLWKYVDELVGKGLEMSVLGEFFFYSAVTLVPTSLPLAILLASLITFGNFGERYELLAMKAAGISLLNIMRPLIIFVTFLCCMSFFFQNVIGPQSSVKLWTLLISMKQKSPELDIPEGVFYDEIDGYNLYVKKKNRKTGVLYDVTIYNVSQGFENADIIVADSGRLEMTADKQHLYLRLYDGEMFSNLSQQQGGMNAQNAPYRRETFREKHSIIEFDAEFNMVDASVMGNQSSSKNMKMLQADIDSMNHVTDSIGRKYYTDAATSSYRPVSNLSKEDTVRIREAHLGEYDVDSLFLASTLAQKQKFMTTATSRAESLKNDWNFKSFTIKQNDQSIRRHKTSWHEKITLSLACLIFFFIGAPLGAIIRKGGLGMPVVISVLIFIIYYIINNTGYKMARDGKWIVWMGMWTSTAVLAPLGAFLTYKSNKDSVVFNADVYLAWIKKVIGIRGVRHFYRKEVIIHVPDYVNLPGRLDVLTEACRVYLRENKLLKAPNYVTLWTTDIKDHGIEAINEQLESMLEEMSNTTSYTLLDTLKNYPIIPSNAHKRPFQRYGLNLALGIVFPVGLFFYFRIWAFRIRLYKDLEKIIRTNDQVKVIVVNSLLNPEPTHN